MKNSNSEARDRTSLDFARRVGVDAFMTRSVSPLGLFRACLKGARKGQLLVATVDNIDPGRKSQAHARVFGQRLAFTPWAVRISQQAKIPLVPGWITWHDGRFVLQHGEPWLGDDIEDGVQHYMSYFEQRILDDPSSWLFIGHRRWARVLNRAVELAAGPGVESPAA
jgi:lauroyl/myristoyl acyltransferase